MSNEIAMTQYAPFPQELAAVVERLRYRPGWRFWLVDGERDPADTHGGQSAGGLTLHILADVMDTYHPQSRRPVMHYRIVPAATYNRTTWERWLMDQLEEVEKHEAREWFVIEEEVSEEHPAYDRRPFAPLHGPGEDPYARVEYASDTQRRTSFRGVVKDA